jgi:hypothetical protein
MTRYTCRVVVKGIYTPTESWTFHMPVFLKYQKNRLKVIIELLIMRIYLSVDTRFPLDILLRNLNKSARSHTIL